MKIVLWYTPFRKKGSVFMVMEASESRDEYVD